jgi:hypothetical protein
MYIYNNILSQQEISKLLEYHYVVDDRTDSRPDVISKHPRWDIDEWPQQIVKRVLDQVLDYDYIVEETIFNQSKISFRLHVDSGNGDVSKLGDSVLVPLFTQGPGSTVFFDNYWHGPSTKFSRVKIPTYEYSLPAADGTWHYVPDLRDLLQQIDNDPDGITWIKVDPELRNTVVNLISARNSNSISKMDSRTYDYSDIINYDPESRFPEDCHRRFLDHIPIENLHGLTLEGIADWQPGDVIRFDRKQLHCAGSGHDMKIGITIFTLRA